MTDFLNFDLCKTSELVSSGELSAAELTKASIDRAEAFQPKLNSFISLEKKKFWKRQKVSIRGFARAKGAVLWPVYLWPIKTCFIDLEK